MDWWPGINSCSANTLGSAGPLGDMAHVEAAIFDPWINCDDLDLNTILHQAAAAVATTGTGSGPGANPAAGHGALAAGSPDSPSPTSSSTCTTSGHSSGADSLASASPASILIEASAGQPLACFADEAELSMGPNGRQLGGGAGAQDAKPISMNQCSSTVSAINSISSSSASPLESSPLSATSSGPASAANHHYHDQSPQNQISSTASANTPPLHGADGYLQQQQNSYRQNCSLQQQQHQQQLLAHHFDGSLHQAHYQAELGQQPELQSDRRGHFNSHSQHLVEYHHYQASNHLTLPCDGQLGASNPNQRHQQQLSQQELVQSQADCKNGLKNLLHLADNNDSDSSSACSNDSTRQIYEQSSSTEHFSMANNPDELLIISCPQQAGSASKKQTFAGGQMDCSARGRAGINRSKSMMNDYNVANSMSGGLSNTQQAACSLSLSSNKSTSSINNQQAAPKVRRCRHITDYVLAEEEKRLLIKEGYNDFPMTCQSRPLSKSEERILRKIRRKIRNKKSAQCSRQRKKEYVEDLERKYAAVVRENEELKQIVEQLQVQQQEQHQLTRCQSSRLLPNCNNGNNNNNINNNPPSMPNFEWKDIC